MVTHINEYFFGSAGKLWYVFVLAGVFVLISPIFIYTDVGIVRIVIIASISIFIGAGLKLNYTGIQIDFHNYRHRNFTSVFGFKTGSWKKLPKLRKAVLSSNNVSSQNTPNGISPTFHNNRILYTIALFSDSDYPELFLQTENKNVAMHKSSLLAKALDLDLLAYI